MAYNKVVRLLFLLFAFYILVVESKLGVQNGKHALVEGGKEVIHGFFQVEFASSVVVFQVAEEVGEDFAVLLVEDAISPFEHVVEIAFRVLQQLTEEF